MSSGTIPRSPAYYPASYRIRVAGRLEAEWSEWTGGMAVLLQGTAESGFTTELLGRLPDQAALMGVLERLYAYRVTLLSVECLETENPEGEG